MLLKIADELLAREVLDADQVKRLAQGLPLEEPCRRRRLPPRPPTTPAPRERRQAPGHRAAARRSRSTQE